MSRTGRTALLVGAFSALATAQTAPKLDADCSDVVIFMARGNDAPYHDGRTFPFVEATCGKFAPDTSCDYIDIQFDATLSGDYCAQITEGATNGVAQITAFNAKCPNTKIVVNGYSQGAHVAGDVLGGPGGCNGQSSGIDRNSAAGQAIAAALLWGDVRHTANQPYNVLDGADKQVYPRTGQDLTNLNRYSSVLRAYCAAGDPVCAGGDVVADHLNYFELYTNEAADWVVSKIGKKASTSSSSVLPSSTPAPSSTSTSSETSSTSEASPTSEASSTSEASTTQGPLAPTSQGSVPPFPTSNSTSCTDSSTTKGASAPTSYGPVPTSEVPCGDYGQPACGSKPSTAAPSIPESSVTKESPVSTPYAPAPTIAIPCSGYGQASCPKPSVPVPSTLVTAVKPTATHGYPTKGEEHANAPDTATPQSTEAPIEACAVEYVTVYA